MANNPYALLIDVKRWADRGLYEVVGENFARLGEAEQSIMLRVRSRSVAPRRGSTR